MPQGQYVEGIPELVEESQDLRPRWHGDSGQGSSRVGCPESKGSPWERRLCIWVELKLKSLLSFWLGCALRHTRCIRARPFPLGVFIQWLLWLLLGSFLAIGTKPSFVKCQLNSHNNSGTRMSYSSHFTHEETKALGVNYLLWFPELVSITIYNAKNLLPQARNAMKKLWWNQIKEMMD